MILGMRKGALQAFGNYPFFKRPNKGVVGIEIASLLSMSNKGNGVAPPPHSNWNLLEPSLAK